MAKVGIVIITFIFCVLFLILLGLLVSAIFIKGSNSLKQRKKDKREGIIRFNSIVHIGGLDTPKGCMCQVYLNAQHLSITCGGSEFILKLDKIKNAECQCDVSWKPRIKTKNEKLVTETNRVESCFAIISYEGTYGDFSNIILRDEYTNTYECRRLVDKIKPHLDPKIRKVEL